MTPDRSQFVTHNGSVSTYREFVDALTGAVSGLPEGSGLHILSETVTSPTLARQLAQVLETYPQAQWHQYDPLTSDTAREGARLAFGQDVHTFYDFSQAESSCHSGRTSWVKVLHSSPTAGPSPRAAAC